MKIRSKLLLIYGIIITSLLLVGLLGVWAISGWVDSAKSLSDMHAQNLQAQRFQINMYRQISYATDYLIGYDSAKSEFHTTQGTALLILEILKTDADTPHERDYIESLEETQFELVWIMEKFFERGKQNSSNLNLPLAQERLKEIADEVADEVAALNQYYRTEENKRLTAATGAGSFATLIIIFTALIALVQFIALVFLLQRWLVKPIAIVNKATQTVSSGNLDVKIAMSGKDEWGQLSQTINQMTESLKLFQKKLGNQERLAALGEIASYAAHNIRNPLAGIRAAVQVMLNDSSLDTETSEALNEIIITIDRLDSWLKRLLEYSRPLQLELETSNINQLVQQAVSFSGKPFANSLIKLDWILDNRLPAIDVDPILLEQALAAIVTNAFQAVPDAGIIKIKTEAVKGINGSEWILISISDNGKGVPDRLKPKLFKAFVTSKDSGTGLGLAQTKKIVDIHNGEINLDSKQGIGTTVTIRLPLHVSSENMKTDD